MLERFFTSDLLYIGLIVVISFLSLVQFMSETPNLFYLFVNGIMIGALLVLLFNRRNDEI